MLEAATFDLEGTVIDIEPLHHNGWLIIAKELGLDLDLKTAVETVPNFIGGPTEKIAESLIAMSKSRKTVEDLLERKRELYEILIEQQDFNPRQGFLTVLREIGKLGLLVAIGSMTPIERASLLLERSGLEKLFPRERTVLREDVEKEKPYPDVYQETARRLGVVPSKQLVFEDSRTGVLAARAAGSMVVGIPVYKMPSATVQLVEGGACRIFHEWTEMRIKALIGNLSQETS